MPTMLCKHITDLYSAQMIIEEKIFYPYDYKNKFCADNGLNLLSESNNNNPRHTGVIMNFAWSGVCEDVHIDYDYKKMSSNVLYHQGAWRNFIKAPIKEGNLKLYDVQIINKNGYSEYKTLDEHIEDLVYEKHRFLSFISWQKEKLFYEEKNNFLNRIKNSYFPNPLEIDIAY